MTDEGQKKLNFIQNVLPKLILERNEDLKFHTIVKCSAEACATLDGFMSAIYTVDLVLKDQSGNEKLHQMIVKIMKGDQNFREATHSSLLCSNEVYIYKEVLPYFQKFITESGASFSANWCPRAYFADYKIFPELSSEQETVLAMENLKPLGYRLAPRIDLDETHLRMMIKQIAPYHAVNYAMRIKKDPMLEKLAKGLTPFSYLQENGKENEGYKVLFSAALERFFNLVENDPKFTENKPFYEKLQKFKTKYFHCPLVLMQKFHDNDEVFSIILHGDYNRNNVLFQYDQPEGYDNPKAIKMFDFQEVRYATPAVDLAFFMYMNMPAALRTKIWDSLLELYHETLTNSLLDLLKCDRSDERLKPYSFDNFIEHFKKHAFYGVMIGIHFIPWMASPEDECQKLSDLFETDLANPELWRLCQVVGGADVDFRITAVAQHGFEKGYMDIFD